MKIILSASLVCIILISLLIYIKWDLTCYLFSIHKSIVKLTDISSNSKYEFNEDILVGIYVDGKNYLAQFDGKNPPETIKIYQSNPSKYLPRFIGATQINFDDAPIRNFNWHTFD
jgi:hypothetical protein